MSATAFASAARRGASWLWELALSVGACSVCRSLLASEQFAGEPAPTGHSTLTARAAWLRLQGLVVGLAGAGMLVLGLMYAYLRLSWAGRALRASAQNPDGAALVGISSVKTSAFAFGICLPTNQHPESLT